MFLSKNSLMVERWSPSRSGTKRIHVHWVKKFLGSNPPSCSMTNAKMGLHLIYKNISHLIFVVIIFGYVPQIWMRIGAGANW